MYDTYLTIPSDTGSLSVKPEQNNNEIYYLIESKNTEVITDNLKYKLLLGGLIVLPVILIIIINFPWYKFKSSSNQSTVQK